MSTPKLTGNRCQCTVCGEVFSRERAFDRHRVGEHGVNRRCLTLDEMRARGWQRNKAGVWIMEPLKGAGKSRVRPSEHGGTTYPKPNRQNRQKHQNPAQPSITVEVPRHGA